MKVSDEKVIEIAEWIKKNKATVRKAAIKFNIPKSTIHRAVCERLKNLQHSLFMDCKVVLLWNKIMRHERGGKATKMKYEKLKAAKK